MKHRIAISGSYGGMNLGDEAILEAILKEIQGSSLDVDIVVFSKNPADTGQRHKVRTLAIREIHKDELLAELGKLDLLILGGGGLLFDGGVEEYLRDHKDEPPPPRPDRGDRGVTGTPTSRERSPPKYS